MKQLAVGLSVMLLSFVVSLGSAQAKEGNFKISSSTASCEGISLWDESAYRVSGKCSGLVYPYATELDHYVAWVKLDNGNTVRLGDVDRGYFEGNTSDSFSDIIITAEGTSSPRRPSVTEILSGSIEPLSFDTSRTTTAATPAPTATTNGSTVDSPATTTATAGSVIGKILRALLIIIGVIIVVNYISLLQYWCRKLIFDTIPLYGIRL
jgi:hypothetical protein